MGQILAEFLSPRDKMRNCNGEFVLKVLTERGVSDVQMKQIHFQTCFAVRVYIVYVVDLHSLEKDKG